MVIHGHRKSKGSSTLVVNPLSGKRSCIFLQGFMFLEKLFQNAALQNNIFKKVIDKKDSYYTLPGWHTHTCDTTLFVSMFQPHTICSFQPRLSNFLLCPSLSGCIHGTSFALWGLYTKGWGLCGEALTLWISYFQKVLKTKTTFSLGKRDGG